MTTTDSAIIPVILSGGSGTRLWPVSRESLPKQFWPLISDLPMIAQTATRARGPGFAAPMVVCNVEHRFLVAGPLQQAGFEEMRLVLEPVGRNSAPAILSAALIIAESDPNAVLWMMAADAAIQDVPALHSALEIAVRAARAGHIVTFGMKATTPETGFGYIEVGSPLAVAPGAFTVAEFLEKPDTARAAQLIATGRHVWNAGMFVFTAATLIAEMAIHAPDVLSATQKAVAARTESADFIRLDPDLFAACPNISLDYAVAERTRMAAVVPADLGWSDVGSWNALWELGTKDIDGNVSVGETILHEAHNCYVRTDGITTAVVGLSDLVLVVTADAVLAMPRGRAQDVKIVVDRLKSARSPRATQHRGAMRPWGSYDSLARGDGFQVKRIDVTPGGILSLQKHAHRAEHWVVVSGTANVVRDGQTHILHANQHIFLPQGCTHRLHNPGPGPLVLIEVQSGAYLGEDDIVRLEDVYGRG